MMNFHSIQYGFGIGGPGMPYFGSGLLLIIIWSLLWKGLALWHSAQRNESVWFIVLLIVNTAGILELVYLFGILGLKFNQLFVAHRK